MDTPQSKTCCTCEVPQSLDQFYKDSNNPDGKSYYCKTCRVAYHARRMATPKAIPQEKGCATCGAVKPIDEFGLDKYSKDQHATRCKACKRSENQGFKRANHEKLLAKDRQRYAENPAKARAKTQRWRTKNPEKARAQIRHWRIENPEKIRAKNKRWRTENPEKERAQKNRRHARKKQAPINDLTAEQWKEIQIAFNYRCAYCPPDCKACKKKTHALTRDHVTPYAHNGSNTLWNVIPACKSHNSQKNDGPPLNPVQPLLLTIAPAKPVQYRTKKGS